MDKHRLVQNDLKKSALPQNVDIYEDTDKKRFFQNDLKKHCFRPYVNIFE